MLKLELPILFKICNYLLILFLYSTNDKIKMVKLFYGGKSYQQVCDLLKLKVKYTNCSKPLFYKL